MINNAHATPNATAVRVTATMFAPAPVFSPRASDPSRRARSSFSSATAMTRVAAVPKPCAATTAITEEYTAVLGPSDASAVNPASRPSTRRWCPAAARPRPSPRHAASCRRVTRDNAKSQPSTDLASSSASTIAAPSPATMISGSGSCRRPRTARTSERRGSSRRRRRRGARRARRHPVVPSSAEAPRDVARAVAIRRAPRRRKRPSSASGSRATARRTRSRPRRARRGRAAGEEASKRVPPRARLV